MKILLKHNLLTKETRNDIFMPYSFRTISRRRYFISEEILTPASCMNENKLYFSVIEVIERGDILITLDEVKIIAVDKDMDEFIEEKSLYIVEAERIPRIWHDAFNNLFATLRSYRECENAVYDASVLPIIVQCIEETPERVEVFRIGKMLEVESFDTFVMKGIITTGEYIGSIVLRGVEIYDKTTLRKIATLPDIILEDCEINEKSLTNSSRDTQLEKLLVSIPDERICEILMNALLEEINSNDLLKTVCNI